MVKIDSRDSISEIYLVRIEVNTVWMRVVKKDFYFVLTM